MKVLLGLCRPIQLRVGLYLLLSSFICQASDDLFVGMLGQSISGNVSDNDVVSGIPMLVYSPANGIVTRADGSPGINTDGSFVYTPDAGFNGADQFVYSIGSGGQSYVFAVRVLSGSIQFLAADAPDMVLSVSSANNRTLATLENRDSGIGTQWRAVDHLDGLSFRTELSDINRSSVLETWQPNAAGTDVTVYANNNREWQRFRLERSADGNDHLISQYTGFSMTRTNSGLTAQAVNNTLSDDWLITGPNQTAPPSGFDDEFSVVSGQVIEGNVLLNDMANSADFASFLVTRPMHGDFVGINQLIYDGLAPFGTFEYHPDAGFVGEDEFTYIAMGSASGAPSRLVTVKLVVNELDTNNPVASDDFFATSPEAILTGNVLLNDENSAGGFFDPQAVLIAPPRFGEFVGIGQIIYDGLAPFGEFEYQPNAGFEGLDSFAYQVMNNGEISAVATVFIAVGDVHLSPLANWRVVLDVNSNQNRTPFTLENSGNPLSQAFRISSLASQTGYDLQINGKSLETWQPQGQGLDATLFRSNGLPWQQFDITPDGNGAFVIKSLYVNRELAAASETMGASVITEPASQNSLQRWLIAGLGQSFGPTGTDDQFITSVNTVVSGNVTLNDQPNGFDLLVLPISQPSNGRLSDDLFGGITPFGTFSYLPDPGFIGEDEFVYQVLSSFSGASSRYVTVRITVE